MCSHERYAAVPTEMQGVSQSHGRPISAATNRGLRSAFGRPPCPSVGVIWAWRPAASPASVDPCVLPWLGAFDIVRFSFIEARGVGHILACTVRLIGWVRGPPGIRAFIAMCASGDFWSSRAVGVPHMRTARSVNVTPCVPVVFGFPPERLKSVEVVVGHSEKPESFPFVGGANGGRGEQTPFRIEPERGKVVEDVWESVSDELGDVLQEHVSRSHIGDDPGDTGPEPSVIVNTTFLSGGRERLAGEAGSDEIHPSTPCCAVEGCEIVPDRRPIHGLVFHPRHESGRCVGVPLNVSHGSAINPGEGEPEAHPSVAGAEMEGT